jgi:nucleoside-diphosphate-sugar epimerase
MIAVVTGGTGFLGRRVVKSLLQEGVGVRCLVRRSTQMADLKSFLGDDLWPRLEIVRCDLMDVSSYGSALRGVDVVIHLAAGLAGGAAALFMDSVIPTRVFARACGEAKVPRFVLISSLGVYGAQHLRQDSILDETCPVDPQPQRRDAYSFSKIIQERVCWEMHRDIGLPLVVVRPGVIFGPGRGALSSRLGLSLGGLMLRIGGRRQLPYTYVDNCAVAIHRAATTPGVTGEVFNILDDDLPSVVDVLRAYRRSGRRLKSVWLPQFAIGPLSGAYDRYHRYSQGQLPGVLSRYRADTFWKPMRFSNAKSKSRLGWNPHVPMAQALDQAIRSMPAGKA